MGLQKTKSLLLTGITNVIPPDLPWRHFVRTKLRRPAQHRADIQALFEDLAAADGRSPTLPFTFSHVRGTTEAGAMAEFLLGLREPDLRLRTSRKDLGLHDEICLDAPAWWLLKKKKTMYHTGGRTRRVRSLMQFMMSPLSTPGRFAAEQKTFADIRAYLLTLEPPNTRFAVDHPLAANGEPFVVPTAAAVTAPTANTAPIRTRSSPSTTSAPTRSASWHRRHRRRHYNQSWFGARPGWLVDECRPTGRRKTMPPWTASGRRPPIFTTAPRRPSTTCSTRTPDRHDLPRSFDADLAAYDTRRLGWRSCRAAGAGARSTARIRHEQTRPQQPGPHVRRPPERRRAQGRHRVSQDPLTPTPNRRQPMPCADQLLPGRVRITRASTSADPVYCCAGFTGGPGEQGNRCRRAAFYDQERGTGNWEKIDQASVTNVGGWTALATLALLNSGVNPKDPIIHRVLRSCRLSSRRKTYVVGLQVMVYAEACASEDRERIETLVDWLIQARSMAGPECRGWSYQPANNMEPDNSNTQYARLGLHAGQQAGPGSIAPSGNRFGICISARRRSRGDGITAEIARAIQPLP